MAASAEMANLIFVVGATAVGKSAWAIQLAKHIQANKKTKVGILNSDSIQIYRDLNIGSAKPDFSLHPEITFYLFNELKAPQVCTAGFFRKKALEILHNKMSKKTILTVGGSGFYLQALEKGMYPIESSSLENTLTKRDYKGLYQELKQKDPGTAHKISPNDKYRILRAWHVIKTEGKTISQIKKEFKEQKLPWPYLKIGLQIPKEELLKRVQQRTKTMIQKGLIEETKDLADRGFKKWRPLSSIGYKEVLLYLEGKIKKS